QVKSSEGIKIAELTPGTEYELFYWEDDWQSAGRQMAGKTALVFDVVPSNALYWLVPVDSDREEERPFTVADGRQVWW
ncbi:MAG: transglutaminase domain-containing protein, partial [candidate division Zixibacteria bacterium]|nr:transglutaminase domain-containing protein [candidate division Zixibacteria bacterium]